MSTNVIFVVLQQSIHVIPLFLVTAGCILLLMRARSRAALIMLIGNLLLIAASGVQVVLTVMMISGAMNPEAYGRLAMVLQVLSLCGAVTFGGGFLLMAFSARQQVSGNGPLPPMSSVGTLEE